MAAHGSADRFDYLFEPIDAEPTAGVPIVESVSRARRWWPVPVLAAMVALAGAVVMIQSWPGDVAPGPSGSTTHLLPTPIVTSVPVIEAPPEFVAPPEVTAKVVLEPAPVSAPSPPAPPPSSKPEAREAPAPTVRSPNSVSPEPRPAFPNQHVPDNDDGGPGGGLLGRLGL